MTDTMTTAGLGHVGVSIAFGLVVMTMISATGHISGAHLNPAVTIAFALCGNFRVQEVPGYVLGQTAAAILASIALKTILGDAAMLGATVPTISTLSAFILEVIISMILMFVISAVATDSRANTQNAAWAIGATVAIAALFAGPFCGASMNPARSIGPALTSGHIDHLWIYLFGPILGAVMGAFLYRALRCGGQQTGVTGCC